MRARLSRQQPLGVVLCTSRADSSPGVPRARAGSSPALDSTRVGSSLLAPSSWRLEQGSTSRLEPLGDSSRLGQGSTSRLELYSCLRAKNGHPFGNSHSGPRWRIVYRLLLSQSIMAGNIQVKLVTGVDESSTSSHPSA